MLWLYHDYKFIYNIKYQGEDVNSAVSTSTSFPKESLPNPSINNEQGINTNHNHAGNYTTPTIQLQVMKLRMIIQHQFHLLFPEK